MSDCKYNCIGGELHGFAGVNRAPCPECSELAASAGSKNRFKDWTVPDFEREISRVNASMKRLEKEIPKIKRAIRNNNRKIQSTENKTMEIQPMTKAELKERIEEILSLPSGTYIGSHVIKGLLLLANKEISLGSGLDSLMPEYSEFVGRLFKDPNDMLADHAIQIPDEIYKTRTANLLEYAHAVIGVSTEAAELLDGYKNTLAYTKPIDIANIQEELGDLMFYVVCLMRIFDMSLHDVILKNMEKLKSRYPDGYSDERAKNRNLNKEREILEASTAVSRIKVSDSAK